MIVVVDAGSQQIAGAMMMQAYMHGIEVEKLYDNQLEFWSADDERLERFLTKYPGKVLHRESIKIVD